LRTATFSFQDRRHVIVFIKVPECVTADEIDGIGQIENAFA